MTAVLLLAAIVLVATTVVLTAVSLRAVLALRDRLIEIQFETRGRLVVIECGIDEAIARLAALTVEAADSYDSATFACVSPAGRERIEAATVGLTDVRLN